MNQFWGSKFIVCFSSHELTLNLLWRAGSHWRPYLCLQSSPRYKERGAIIVLSCFLNVFFSDEHDDQSWNWVFEIINSTNASLEFDMWIAVSRCKNASLSVSLRYWTVSSNFSFHCHFPSNNHCLCMNYDLWLVRSSLSIWVYFTAPSFWKKWSIMKCLSTCIQVHYGCEAAL